MTSLGKRKGKVLENRSIHTTPSLLLSEVLSFYSHPPSPHSPALLRNSFQTPQKYHLLCWFPSSLRQKKLFQPSPSLSVQMPVEASTRWFHNPSVYLTNSPIRLLGLLGHYLGPSHLHPPCFWYRAWHRRGSE